MGLGRRWVSSARRVPRPPARMTAFIRPGGEVGRLLKRGLWGLERGATSWQAFAPGPTSQPPSCCYYVHAWCRAAPLLRPCWPAWGLANARGAGLWHSPARGCDHPRCQPGRRVQVSRLRARGRPQATRLAGGAVHLDPGGHRHCYGLERKPASDHTGWVLGVRRHQAFAAATGLPPARDRRGLCTIETRLVILLAIALQNEGERLWRCRKTLVKPSLGVQPAHG